MLALTQSHNYGTIMCVGGMRPTFIHQSLFHSQCHIEGVFRDSNSHLTDFWCAYKLVLLYISNHSQEGLLYVCIRVVCSASF